MSAKRCTENYPIWGLDELWRVNFFGAAPFVADGAREVPEEVDLLLGNSGKNIRMFSDKLPGEVGVEWF